MEVEIGEYQKTLDEMSAAMANLNQEDYGSTIRIQELERRCEIASKQSGHVVSHHQHHMAEAWRKFEGEAQQMRKVEMNRISIRGEEGHGVEYYNATDETS